MRALNNIGLIKQNPFSFQDALERFGAFGDFIVVCHLAMAGDIFQEEKYFAQYMEISVR